MATPITTMTTTMTTMVTTRRRSTNLVDEEALKGSHPRLFVDSHTSEDRTEQSFADVTTNQGDSYPAAAQEEAQKQQEFVGLKRQQQQQIDAVK